LKHIGLFGGTFNPIHIGHLRSAWEVHQEFNLDVTYLIPSAIPPHKSPRGIAGIMDRLQMVRLAVSNCPEFDVSDTELRRSGPSYSIDTIRYFSSEFSNDSKLYLIVGIDAFLEIDTWKFFGEIFRRIPFIVMMRPNRGRPEQKILADFLTSKVSGGYQFDETRHAFVNGDFQNVYVMNVTLMDISATNIRKMILDKKSIRFLVPDAVEQYIHTKGLYQ